MNWKEIHEKYPKGSGLLNKWLIDPLNERDLYDFFDEQGIYCTVDIDQRLFYQSQRKEILWDWSYVTQSGKGEGGGDLKTRNEAEEEVFTRAFSVLEDEISQKGYVSKIQSFGRFGKPKYTPDEI